MVHKIELEMQHEELQRTHTLMEESRDQYLAFYEFSPIGYLTLSCDGLIREINLTGCTLLGIERFRIMSRRLSSYIAASDKDRWHRMLTHIVEHTDIAKQAFDLEMMRADGSVFKAYLHCVKHVLADSSFELRIAVTDISHLRQ